MDEHRLGSLLGRWHQWRRAYSHERGYARPALVVSDTDLEDELEQLTMRILDATVEALPRDLQLAAQHAARAECLGVEVIMNPRLGGREERDRLVQRALAELQRRLEHEGVL